jgi:phage-related protein
VVRKPIFWVDSAEKDFSAFPEKVHENMESALAFARLGGKAEHAKPLKGFPGASVLEISESDSHGTYRCIYTVKFRTRIYVLHAFQKKSHKGITTPKEHIDMIKRRLKRAAEIEAEILQHEKKGK